MASLSNGGAGGGGGLDENSPAAQQHGVAVMGMAGAPASLALDDGGMGGIEWDDASVSVTIVVNDGARVPPRLVF